VVQSASFGGNVVLSMRFIMTRPYLACHLFVR